MDRTCFSNRIGIVLEMTAVRAGMLLLMLFPAACSSPGQDLSATAVDEVTTPSESLTDTGTDLTNPSGGKVLLFGASDSGLLPMDEIQNEVESLANASGLEFIRVGTLTSNDIGSEVVVVIVVENDPDLVDLSRGAPTTQFLAIHVPGIFPSDNLSLLGGDGIRMDRQGFVSGYVAAMIADDWRVGAIAFGDQPEVRAALLGFLNGARYFCGLCRPAYPPFLEYPLFIDLYSIEQGWSEARATIETYKIQVVYLTPISAFGTQIDDLLTTNTFIMGDGPRPEYVPAERWIATIKYDVVGGLRSLWSDLVAGNGGMTARLKLEITDVNSDLLSPGRERLAREILGELEAGFIDTDENPPEANPGDD